MAVATFDTLKFANSLKAAGVPDKQAEAEAAAISEALAANFKDLVTKEDLKNELLQLRTELKNDGLQLRTELKSDIRDTEQIDDGRDFRHRPQTGGRRRHRNHQRQMPARGTARRDNPFGIHLVLSGVVLKPLRRLENIVDGGRGRCRLKQPVLDIRHHHAVPHEWEAIFFEHVFFVAFHPAAAVDEDDAWPVGERGRARLNDIEDGLRIVVVMNIGLDLVVERGCGGTKGEQ